MRRKSTKDAVVAAPVEQQPSTPPPLRTIEVTAVGSLAEWGDYLGLPRHCLRREARLARLVTFRRAGRLWTDGASILKWLHAGRVHRQCAVAEVPEIDRSTAQAG
jgi:hypothetical protein